MLRLRYISGEVVRFNPELRVLSCLLTQAEIVMLEVCRDIKTKGRANDRHVGERPQKTGKNLKRSHKHYYVFMLFCLTAVHDNIKILKCASMRMFPFCPLHVYLYSN